MDMKIIYKCFFAATILLLPVNAIAQQVDIFKHPVVLKDSSYTAMYNTLKQLSVKERASDSFKKMDSLTKAFNAKMNADTFTKKQLTDDDKRLAWIRQNIATTRFDSYEAAVTEWEAVKESSKKLIAENIDLYAYMVKAVQLHGSSLLADVMTEVIIEDLDNLSCPAPRY